MVTGKKINERLNIGARHALYFKDGNWFHHLNMFPGVLIDRDGYVIFNTKEDYENSNFLDHGEHLHVSKGISSIPGYVNFTKTEKDIIADLIT